MTSPKLRDRARDYRNRSSLLSAPWWFYLLVAVVFSGVALGWREVLVEHHYALGFGVLAVMALIGLGGEARKRWRRRHP